MMYITIIIGVLLAVRASAYKVSFYDGTMCNGAFLQSNTFEDYSCYNVPVAITGTEASAYISSTGDDDGLIVEFYPETGCSGNPIAQVGGSGCASTFENGQVLSVRQTTIPAKRSALSNQSYTFTSPHETYSRARLAAGLEEPILPEQPEGYKLLDISPGHWVVVENNMTLSSFYSKYGFDSNVEIMDLNFKPHNNSCIGTNKPSECYPDFVKSNMTTNGTLTSDTDTSVAISERNLESVCKVLYYCSLPFYAANSAYQIYQEDIAPIINSAPVQTLWGVANNGYIIGYATHYYFVKTTNSVPASTCSTASTDKDEIISGLQEQLAAVQSQADVYYSALAQCLSTNQPSAGVTTGSLSMTGWTTMTSSSRCQEQSCS